jgi:hypothetical protein
MHTSQLFGCQFLVSVRFWVDSMTFDRYGKNRTTGTGAGLTPHHQAQKERISGKQDRFCASFNALPPPVDVSSFSCVISRFAYKGHVNLLICTAPPYITRLEPNIRTSPITPPTPSDQQSSRPPTRITPRTGGGCQSFTLPFSVNYDCDEGCVGVYLFCGMQLR